MAAARATPSRSRDRALPDRYENHGWAEHEVYPGIGATIDALYADGHRLAVVTAEYEPHARKIVGQLPFAHRFDDIIGASADGRLGHKPELIAEALRDWRWRRATAG